MAEVLLFHAASGMTEGVLEFADRLRDAGHTVHAPDLFDGRVFEDVGEGVSYANEIDFGARADEVAADLPAELVYAGMSLGVMPAQRIAQTRAGARGAVLMYSFVDPESFSPAWPDGVPAQIHGKDGDEFFAGDGDIDAARAFVEVNPAAELFVYPGEEHLFADSSLPTYDAEASALLMQRVLGFLAGR